MSATPRLPVPHERPWLTVAELAAITGEGEKAIRSAIDAGHLPHLQVGRYVRIPTAELLRRVGITTLDGADGDRTDEMPPTTLHDLTRDGRDEHTNRAS